MKEVICALLFFFIIGASPSWAQWHCGLFLLPIVFVVLCHERSHRDYRFAFGTWLVLTFFILVPLVAYSELPKYQLGEYAVIGLFYASSLYVILLIETLYYLYVTYKKIADPHRAVRMRQTHDLLFTFSLLLLVFPAFGKTLGLSLYEPECFPTMEIVDGLVQLRYCKCITPLQWIINYSIFICVSEYILFALLVAVWVEHRRFKWMESTVLFSLGVHFAVLTAGFFIGHSLSVLEMAWRPVIVSTPDFKYVSGGFVPQHFPANWAFVIMLNGVMSLIILGFGCMTLIQVFMERVIPEWADFLCTQQSTTKSALFGEMASKV